MGYITHKKPATHNYRSAVCCQIDGTFQYLICIDRLLDSYRTKVTPHIKRNYKWSNMHFNSCDQEGRVDFANLAHSK